MLLKQHSKTCRAKTHISHVCTKFYFKGLWLNKIYINLFLRDKYYLKSLKHIILVDPYSIFIGIGLNWTIRSSMNWNGMEKSECLSRRDLIDCCAISYSIIFSQSHFSTNSLLKFIRQQIFFAKFLIANKYYQTPSPAFDTIKG